MRVISVLSAPLPFLFILSEELPDDGLIFANAAYVLYSCLGGNL